MNENTKLWERHRTPPDDALKKFRRAGGFSGTAIDPMWMIWEATKEWGPMGGRWTVNVKEERIERLADGWILHTCNIILSYPCELMDTKQTAHVVSTGNTWLVWTTSDGKRRYDDEASKKSLTDAISKALSWLGIGADVYMGMHDGNKYQGLFDVEEALQENPEEGIIFGVEEGPVRESGYWIEPEDIPDDMLDVVKENYRLIQKRSRNAAWWHKQILTNFMGMKINQDQSVKEVIKGLDKETLWELSQKQNEHLKLSEEDA